MVEIEVQVIGAAAHGTTGDEAQYADFSGFQQHLLKEMPPPPVQAATVSDWVSDGTRAGPAPLRRRRTMSMAEKSVLVRRRTASKMTNLVAGVMALAPISK